MLHVGKTGGTAIKGALKSHRSTEHFLIHLHPHPTKLMDIRLGEGVFFFLRDPVSRFVSSFNSRLRQGQPRLNTPWSPAEREIFARFDRPDRLARALSSLDANQRAFAEKAMRKIGHVRDHFSKWFDSWEYLLSRQTDIIHIGFQETLEADFEALKIKLQLPEAVKLPTDDMGTHRTPLQFDQTLSPESLANLKKWYRDDIDFYLLCRGLMAKEKSGRPCLDLVDSVWVTHEAFIRDLT